MMSNLELPFSRSEYEARLDSVRKSMELNNVEILFTCDPSNMAWLTGYDGWSFYVHQGVIVGPKGDPIFWGRKMDAIGATLTCYMSNDRIHGYTDDFVMSDNHAMLDLSKIISDYGWKDMALGVEMDNYYYSAKAHNTLSSNHSGKITDTTGLINWCRAIKSDQELKYMRRAGQIVERMHAKIFDIFEVGKRKNEVAAEIYHTGIWGGEDEDGLFGGDYAAICPLLPTNKEATAAHLTWNDKIIPNNSGTFFEIAGVHRHYHVPLSRTIWLGEPPRDISHAEEVVLEGIEAGISKAISGNTAGDVARAFYNVLKKHGVKREGRCGYPIGISYPPDWGERTYSIRPSDETVLKPNMTFHFMPALWMTDWGLEITETLRIREDGIAESLANVPRKLFVKS